MSQPDAAEVGDRLAPASERHRERLFENFRAVSEWLVDQIDPQPGQTILELTAGTGETGFLAAERVGATGRLISTDVAPGMVEAARRGAEARGLDNVKCRVMDAQHIDLPDASVDGVISRFGMMLLPDTMQAVSEARRILRQGRRLAYAVPGPPDRNPGMSVLMDAVIESGHAPPGDSLGSGAAFSLATPDQNRKVLADAGSSDVRVEEIAGFLRFHSFDDYWGFQSSVAGPAALLLASLAADDVSAIRAAVEAALAPFESGGGYATPWYVVAVSAN